jgi:ferredoxin
MAYVITRLCRDCKDTSCVDACPVDCIVEHRPPSGVSDLPNQLFIDPDECIDCSRCVSECPWEAIFEEADVPLALLPDVALNAIVPSRRVEFRRPEVAPPPRPTPEAVAANSARWGVPSRPEN